jgi:hypothetical protein
VDTEKRKHRNWYVVAGGTVTLLIGTLVFLLARAGKMKSVAENSQNEPEGKCENREKAHEERLAMERDMQCLAKMTMDADNLANLGDPDKAIVLYQGALDYVELKGMTSPEAIKICSRIRGEVGRARERLLADEQEAERQRQTKEAKAREEKAKGEVCLAIDGRAYAQAMTLIFSFRAQSEELSLDLENALDELWCKAENGARAEASETFKKARADLAKHMDAECVLQDIAVSYQRHRPFLRETYEEETRNLLSAATGRCVEAFQRELNHLR